MATQSAHRSIPSRLPQRPAGRCTVHWDCHTTPAFSSLSFPDGTLASVRWPQVGLLPREHWVRLTLPLVTSGTDGMLVRLLRAEAPASRCDLRHIFPSPLSGTFLTV
jgi:hypothetical protein